MRIGKVLAILLALVVVGSLITIAGAASAKKTTYFKTEPNGYSITFPEPNERQLKMIEKLYGRNITLGEYIEKVHSEVREGIPKNVKKKLYATKIVWPNPPEFNQENIHSDTVVSRFTKIDEGDKITINSWYPIVIAHGSGLDASWPSITYNSWSRVILPHPWYKLPYMAVYSYLWYKKDENSSPALVAMKAVNG